MKTAAQQATSLVTITADRHLGVIRVGDVWIGRYERKYTEQYADELRRTIADAIESAQRDAFIEASRFVTNAVATYKKATTNLSESMEPARREFALGLVEITSEQMETVAAGLHKLSEW